MFTELRKIREALERQNTLMEAQTTLFANMLPMIVLQLKRIADAQSEPQVVGVDGEFTTPTPRL